MGMMEFKCDWCGATLTHDMMTLDEHDIPRWCPECGHDARKAWVKSKERTPKHLANDLNSDYSKYTDNLRNDPTESDALNPENFNIGVLETMKRMEDHKRLIRDIVKRQANDAVNHPGHYTFGDIEVIDYIRDKLTPEEFQGYCCGNILKYVSRHKHKNGAEDLKKAQVYLGWLIESEEAAE